MIRRRLLHEWVEALRCRRIGHPLIVIVRIYMVVGSVKSTLGHAFRFVGLTYASQPLAHAVPFARLCTDVGG